MQSSVAVPAPGPDRNGGGNPGFSAGDGGQTDYRLPVFEPQMNADEPSPAFGRNQTFI